MTDNSQRALADTVFLRDAGEREPSDALKLEETRRAVENMRRSRALRLAQNKEH
jgi:hypothetical protein